MFGEFLQNIFRIVNNILYINHTLKYLIICFSMLKYTYGFPCYIACDIIVICNCKLKKHNQNIFSDVVRKIRVILLLLFFPLRSITIEKR